LYISLHPIASIETWLSAPWMPGNTCFVKSRLPPALWRPRFANGARGAMCVSQVTAGRKNQLTFEIAGSEGSLAWDSEHPNDLWLGHREKPNELLIRDPSLLAPGIRSFASYPGGHNEGFPDTFKQLYRAIYEYLAKGDFSRPKIFAGFEDGHEELLLCEAILQSHRAQAWVPVRRNQPESS
jgi:predicted dehydrogenase